MNELIDARVDRIAQVLPKLVDRLSQRQYAFTFPDEVFPGPEPDVDRFIQRIEFEVGAVPYALASFWRRIGSINLCGSHPDWIGCEYPDPLVVYSVTNTVAELDEYLENKEERLKADAPYLIPIAPDDYHKENVSGGMWYNVICPAVEADPIINDERHDLSLLDYLDLAVELGGFLGLDRAKRHSWPVEVLSAGLRSAG